MVMKTLLSINVSETPIQNFHRLLNSVAVNPLAINEYTLGTPVPVKMSDKPYFNTEISIISASPKYRGADTLYYHRFDIGNKGVSDGGKTKYMERQVRVDSLVTTGNNQLLTDICSALNVIKSEFTLRKVEGRSDYNYIISAKRDSLLYIGELGIRVALERIGGINQVVDGFYPPIDEGTDSDKLHLVKNESEMINLIRLISAAFTGDLSLDMYVMEDADIDRNPRDDNDASMVLRIKPDFVGRGPDMERVYYRRVYLNQYIGADELSFVRQRGESATDFITRVRTAIDDIVETMPLSISGMRQHEQEEMIAHFSSTNPSNFTWTLNAIPESSVMRGSVNVVLRNA